MGGGLEGAGDHGCLPADLHLRRCQSAGVPEKIRGKAAAWAEVRRGREAWMTEQLYKPSELLICTASRLMEDGTTAFIGTGIPMLAASLAPKRHAPDLVTIFEFGGTGAILESLPLGVGGSCTFPRSSEEHT